MMWHRVIPAWLALLIADQALMQALNGVAVTPAQAAAMTPDELQEALAQSHIYPAQAARKVGVPSVEYTLPIIDRETELFNPITIQVDYWVRGVNRAAVIENRLRTLTHRDTSRVIGGMRMWTRYLDSRSHEYRAAEGVTHQSLDFLFEPLRSKYQDLQPVEPEA